MIITILFVFFGTLALIALLYLARRRRVETSSYASLVARLERVPVGALFNLLDAAQQTYLERVLPNHQYVRLQRLRTRVLLRYFRAIYRNAGIVLHCANAAAHSDRPEIAKAGRELLQLAMFTRVQSLRALFVLTFALIVPTRLAGLVPIATKYASAISRSSEIATALAAAPVSA